MNRMQWSSLSPAKASPDDNILLAELTADIYGRLLPHLQLVPIQLGQVIVENGGPPEHVYFPITGIVSYMYDLQNGSTTGVAVIGNDGVVGVSLLLGGDHFPYHAIVQSAGYAYRLKANILRAEFNKSGILERLLLLYTQALLTQISQTAVCNRHHTIEQQLCRWLLLSLDRSTTNDLHMTQELIANNLGVRREGVTEAAHKLQTDQLIHYYRGLISVPNRLLLEARVCECYAVVQHEYERLYQATEIGPFPNPQHPHRHQFAIR